MAMHERRSMGCYFDFEDAHVLVFNREVVRWFSRNLDFGRRLRRKEWDQQKKEQYALMAVDCSTRESSRRSAINPLLSGVHNLPTDNRCNHFPRQLPSIEGRVLRFRARFGGVECPLLLRIENRNVSDRASDQGPAASKIEAASGT